MRKIFLALFLVISATVFPSYTPDTPKYEYFYHADKIPVPVAQQLVGRGQYIQQVLDKQDNLPHGLVRELKAQVDTMLMLYTETLKLDSTIRK